MCGIFGLIAEKESDLTYKKVKRIVDALFILSESRGKESSGIAIADVRFKTINILKKPIPATRLLKNKDYREFFKEAVENCFSQSKEGRSISDSKIKSPFAIIAHTRLITSGSQFNNNNNQPVVKNGFIVAHNGMIVNVNDLWEKYDFLKKDFEVDTEILTELLKHNLGISKSIVKAAVDAFNEIEGSASIAAFINGYDKVLFATNTGSLYRLVNQQKNIFIFSSEKYILSELCKRENLLQYIGGYEIEQIQPFRGMLVDLNGGKHIDFKLGIKNTNDFYSKDETAARLYEIKDATLYDKVISLNDRSCNINLNKENREEKLLEYNLNSINKIKRCCSCVLPETFPFIEFDKDGLCNYCRNYKKIDYKGHASLEEVVKPHKNRSGKPDCILTFSGGRDSSYGLHYIREVLKLNPIAYTYDWGMVNDLARRNQARLCGKLGVEQILISADIGKKRSNVRKNVCAWLRRPHLGTVPLFMAGDKQYFYYANLLKKKNDIQLVVLCENMLENTNFKSGFCGIEPNFGAKHTYSLSIFQQFKLAGFYAKEFLLNPRYLNSSLLDTAGAFISYYLLPHDYLNVYDYIEWNEELIEKTLINLYGWELAPDTKITWRIGDGTAAFYNYIYYTVAGFSEIDTFRSNQIREGVLRRQAVLENICQENKPRYEPIKWYLDTIKLDFEEVIKRINSIPKVYTLR